MDDLAKVETGWAISFWLGHLVRGLFFPLCQECLEGDEQRR